MASKNPDPWPMKDATNNDSVHNDGIVNESAARGQTFVRAFGLDRSTEAGMPSAERSTERGFGGGINNVSHSLKGPSANQTGRSRG